MKKITVLVLEPGQEPYIKEIKNGLLSKVDSIHRQTIDWATMRKKCRDFEKDMRERGYNVVDPMINRLNRYSKILE